MAKASENGVWDQDLPGGPTLVKRTPSFKQVVKAKVVRDDWDDDDDDEEEEQVLGERERNVNGYTKAIANGTRNDSTALDPGLSVKRTRETDGRTGEDSSKIWEEANKRAPMPELIVAPASTSQCFPPPPPAAFRQTLRILKRPSPNANANDAGAVPSASPSSGPASSSGSGGTSPAPRGTLAEREAQYQEARNRIFGEQPGSTSGNTNSGSGGVVVCDPLGPTSELEPEMGGRDKVHDLDRRAKGFGERRRGKK